MRELSKHLAGTIPTHRRRRRYCNLQFQQSSSCLNCIVVFRSPANRIAAQEALAITAVNPRANGNELKHLSEIFRRTQKPKGGTRSRSTQSSRTNKRRADIRNEQEQWGHEVNTHAKGLDLAHSHNVIKLFNKLTNRHASAHSMKTDLSLTPLEMYRSEQIKQGCKGPVLIYQLSNVLLFLKYCADLKLSKKVSVHNFLYYAQRPIDYCFHMAELCAHFTSYRQRVRAFTVIKNFLSTHHMYLAPSYYIRTMAGYDTSAIRKWARTVILQAGRHTPNWMAYVLGRIKAIEIPPPS